jgi:hypothetical protein
MTKKRPTTATAEKTKKSAQKEDLEKPVETKSTSVV